ncbi:MAG: PTS mannose/fructose/sorbose transporter subunit IIC, partial [[Pasteurella] aerogenes]|nr:PTS mannose/fructose/sorbose transporter subunit IIC [[Pasteurella] aerogenes]
SFSNYNLVGLGFLGACLAMIYIQLNPRFNQANLPQQQPRTKKLADNELEGL